tara:strand:+ start:5649 stop:5876 length:228 start_codon:yes stop_codon:yes gene_type:complete
MNTENPLEYTTHLKEYLRQEIKDAKEYFKNNEHFEEVSKQLEADAEGMRAFDVGLIKAFEQMLRKLEWECEDEIL